MRSNRSAAATLCAHLGPTGYVQRTDRVVADPHELSVRAKNLRKPILGFQRPSHVDDLLFDSNVLHPYYRRIEHRRQSLSIEDVRQRQIQAPLIKRVALKSFQRRSVLARDGWRRQKPIASRAMTNFAKVIMNSIIG